jgi:hypothetical protein
MSSVTYSLKKNETQLNTDFQSPNSKASPLSPVIQQALENIQEVGESQKDLKRKRGRKKSSLNSLKKTKILKEVELSPEELLSQKGSIFCFNYGVKLFEENKNDILTRAKALNYIRTASKEGFPEASKQLLDCAIILAKESHKLATNIENSLNQMVNINPIDAEDINTFFDIAKKLFKEVADSNSPGISYELKIEGCSLYSQMCYSGKGSEKSSSEEGLLYRKKAIKVVAKNLEEEEKLHEKKIAEASIKLLQLRDSKLN